MNLIITHHPVMFRSVKKLTDETSEGRTILTLLESGIAVYSPHTAFDSTFSGINQQFAEALGLLEIQPLRPSTSSETVGSGRLGRLLSSETPTNFVKRVTTALNLSSLEVSLNCGTVQRVAVACGAASEFLPDAIRLQCDTFITGEARFHSILEARAAGLNLILVGHYASERFAVERLSQEIGRRFPSLCSFASEAEENPTRIMTA